MSQQAQKEESSQRNENHVLSVMDHASFATSMQMDPYSRSIYILEDISDELSRRFIPAFLALDASQGDITIIMSSTGGSMIAGQAIHGVIANARNKTRIVAISCAYSMAAVILQAADERIIEESCRFMFHDGSATLGSTEIPFLHKTTKEIGVRVDQNLRILANRSGIPLSEIREMSSGETYLSAHQTVKMGFADKVMRSKKKRKK